MSIDNAIRIANMLNNYRKIVREAADNTAKSLASNHPGLWVKVKTPIYRDKGSWEVEFACGVDEVGGVGLHATNYTISNGSAVLQSGHAELAEKLGKALDDGMKRHFGGDEYSEEDVWW